MILSMGLFVFVMDEGMNPKELHKHFLENSPFKEDVLLNKKDRLSKGLPPNKFNEQIYDLTIDPVTGEHNYESKLDVQEQIQRDIYSDRYAVPGQSATTPWYEIGPKNAAGRSRAAVWDQSDLGGTRVIAGGVSGGLWINNDITDVGQVWTRVLGVPGNLAISVIVQDPNNTSVLYAGTGESYTGGDASGNGIYKSIDGGSNWNLVFGRGQSTTVTTTFSGGYTRVEGYFAVNDIILYDHDNNTGTDAQVFAAIGTTWHSRSSSTGLDPFTYGLFKSADAGSTFTQITSVNNGSQVDEINDLEVQAISNTIWLSTTSSNYWGGVKGGRFFYSDDGTYFTQATPTFPAFPTTSATTRHRTEIAPSQTDTNTHYVLIETSSTSSSTADYTRIPIIYKTTDNFSTFTYVEPPIDSDQGIPNYDFTRGQSFYDLEIEVDPTNDDILYVGGIDWFRSQNGGTSWSQITRWSQFNPGLFGKPYSVIHADQHGLYFKPGDPNKAIVVNDGGVAYSSSLSTASDTSTFGDREKELITLQFYTVAQSPPDFAGNDYIVGGTQDNGTWSIIASANNKTNGTEVQGGDGAATVFDQVGGDYYISNYIYNNSIQRAGFTAGGVAQPHVNLSNSLSLPSNEGDFINPAALDSNRDVYFSCAGNGKIRVITGLERDGTIQHFLINFSGTRHVTALEVSRHTTNTTTLFAGLSDGEVLKISNAGANGASTITSVYNQTGSVSDIHIGETEDDVYLTYFNYGIANNIVYTDDGFETSSNKEGDLPDFPVLSILNNPYVEDEVIIGTELGIWRTANFTTSPNPTWVPARNGMSDVPVYDMDFRGVSALDNRVVAASYGRGVYTGSFTSPNNPPVTTTEIISVLEAGTASTTTSNATSVLANDTDPEEDALTADLVSNPINGDAFAMSNTGSFTYTHDGSETTTDSFSYRAYDNALYGNTVTVTINITPVNDCPEVAIPIADFSVQEDATDDTFDISNLFSDSDLPEDVLNYTFTNDNTDLVTVTLDTNTLTLDYIDDQTGVATITINASDGDGACSSQEVFVVTVTEQNDSPVTIAETISVLENGTASTTTSNATSVLANDTDPDTESDELTADLVSNPINGAAFAMSNTGSFTYTHDGSETTTDSFSYRAYDNALYGNTVTVTINITPVNDCPEVAIPIADFSVQEDATDDTFDISNLFSDSDLPEDVLNYTFTNDNTDLVTVTLDTNTLTLDYIDDQTGVATITINASDGDGACSSQEVFVVTVTEQNDSPVTIAETISVLENGTASTTTSNATSVLANDTDPDTESDELTADLVSNPINGAAFAMSNTGSFTYTHDGSETTTDSFSYRAYDNALYGNTVTVTINITPVNDCPEVAIPIADFSVQEDATDDTFDISNLFSDSDLPEDVLNYTFTNDNTDLVTVTLDTNTLTLDYIDDQSGVATVTINASDGDGTCSSQEVFVVTVTAVNDSPITIAETISVLEAGTASTTTSNATSVLANDTDTESDELTAIKVSNPTNGTLTLLSSGTFSYTHDGSETTTDTFQYKTNDGNSDGNTITVNINIQEINDCPTVTENPPISFSYPEDTSNWGYTYNVFITDDDGGTPIYTLTNIGTDLITAQITNQANGSVQIYPVSNQHGTTTMTLNVNDTRGCDLDILIPVTLSPVNDCPTLDNPIADISATEDDPDLYIPLANVFSDIDSDTLTYSSYVGDSTKIASSITATALVVSYLPNQNGSTYISLMVSDGDINCTVDDLITVSITQTNDAPSGLEDFISVSSGGTVIVLNDGATNSVLANDIDPEGDAITAVEVLAPVNGSLTLFADGTFTYTHDGSATTTDVFIYTPRDNFSIGNTTTVTIYINDLPVGVTETIALFEGGTATTTTNAATSVLVNDTDANAGDAALLTASIGTSPLHGTLSLNGNGSFVYNHGGTENFSDSFTYIPYDGKGYGLPTSVSITITPTNDAPIAYPDNITVGLGGTANFLTNGVDNVLLNDVDTDGDVMTVSLVSSPTFGTLILNPGGTFSYVQNGVMNGGDSFTYKANDGTVDSNVVAVNIDLTCSPCTQSTIVGGSNGVFFNYQGCDCNSYQVFVPKGKSYTFCHLDNSIAISQGAYTVIATSVCN